MSDTLLACRRDSLGSTCEKPRNQMSPRSRELERSARKRQAEGSSEQVLFSTIRGSGWPRLNSISAGVEIWPSATANGTE